MPILGGSRTIKGGAGGIQPTVSPSGRVVTGAFSTSLGGLFPYTLAGLRAALASLDGIGGLVQGPGWKTTPITVSASPVLIPSSVYLFDTYLKAADGYNGTDTTTGAGFMVANKNYIAPGASDADCGLIHCKLDGNKSNRAVTTANNLVVFGNMTRPRLNGCYAFNGPQNGFVFDACTYPSYSDCTSDTHGDQGFYVSMCDGLNGVNSRARGNGFGNFSIRNAGSIENVLTGCLSEECGDRGFRVSISQAVRLSGCVSIGDSIAVDLFDVQRSSIDVLVKDPLTTGVQIDFVRESRLVVQMSNVLAAQTGFLVVDSGGASTNLEIEIPYLQGSSAGSCKGIDTSATTGTVLVDLGIIHAIGTPYTLGSGTRLVGLEKTKAYWEIRGAALSLLGGIRSVPVTKNATGSLAITDMVVAATAGAGGITLTLPTPVGISGATLRVKKVDAAAGAVTIATAAGLIDGAATKAIAAQYEAYDFVSNNVDWMVF